MSSQKKVTILGGDDRQTYMVGYFIQENYSVTTYGVTESTLTRGSHQAVSLEEACNFGELIVGPLPLTRDQIHINTSVPKQDLLLENLKIYLTSDHYFIAGNIPEHITDHCKEHHIPYFDLMKDDKIAILNAISTAEGTIMEAIRMSKINLHGSKCLVLGYGRCAAVLARKLAGLHADVTISARKERDLASAISFGYDSFPLSQLKQKIGQFDFIFNSIPVMIMPNDILDQVGNDTTIIDLSSAPGGLDFNYAKEKNLNAYLFLGIPGKISPKASAEILVKAIVEHL